MIDAMNYTFVAVIGISMYFGITSVWGIVQNAIQNGGMFTWKALGVFILKIFSIFLLCVLGTHLLPPLVASFFM